MSQTSARRVGSHRASRPLWSCVTVVLGVWLLLGAACASPQESGEPSSPWVTLVDALGGPTPVALMQDSTGSFWSVNPAGDSWSLPCARFPYPTLVSAFDRPVSVCAGIDGQYAALDLERRQRLATLDVPVIERSRPLAAVEADGRMHLFVDAVPTLNHIVLDSAWAVQSREEIYGFYPAPIDVGDRIDLAYVSTLPVRGRSRNELFFGSLKDGSWAEPLAIHADSMQRSHTPAIAATGSQRRAIAWLEDADLDGRPEAVMTMTRDASGDWGRPSILAEADDAHSAGRPSILASGGEALVAFSVFDEAQTAYFAVAVGPGGIGEPRLLGTSPGASSGVALVQGESGPEAIWMHRGVGLHREPVDLSAGG